MKQKIKAYLPYIIVLILVVATSTVYLVIDIKKGWTGEKTIAYLSSFTIFVCGISSYEPIASYNLSNDYQMIKSNNELFRTIEKVESLELLMKYKQIKDCQLKDKMLEEINNYLSSKDSDCPKLTHETINEFFEEKRYLKKPFELEFDDQVELLVKYRKYSSLYSKDFEKLYSDYKTRDMIRRQPFPLFNTLIPFILGAIGLFALIYQEINSTEKLTNSLLVYVAVLAEVFVMGIFYTWVATKNSIPAKVKENNTTIEELNSLMCASKTHH